jgi:hypothetical protein
MGECTWQVQRNWAAVALMNPACRCLCFLKASTGILAVSTYR